MTRSFFFASAPPILDEAGSKLIPETPGQHLVNHELSPAPTTPAPGYQGARPQVRELSPPPIYKAQGRKHGACLRPCRAWGLHRNPQLPMKAASKPVQTSSNQFRYIYTRKAASI
ncbi:MAG: hypothetical protein CL886_07635 [Dehalococcoidia bacterium]|nr:hypothetical protein [Dehalococcoidia bacterium]|tara:strand:+ start:3356 stop:3700 length:345 start_codon:yes stop_codon:yes gene_type:complete